MLIMPQRGVAKQRYVRLMGRSSLSYAELPISLTEKLSNSINIVTV